MTKKLITLLFLTVALNAFGQDNHEVSEKKWKIGAFIMPTIQTYYETSKEVDLTLLAGIKIETNILNTFSLSSGLHYIRTNLYLGGWHGGFCGFPINCYVYSKTDFVEIPLKVKRYYLKEKQNVNPYISFGVVNSFSLKIETKRIDEIGNTTFFYDNQFKYQQSWLSVSFGTELKLTERFELSIDPTFRYSIHSITRAMDITNYTVFVGLGLGLNYKL